MSGERPIRVCLVGPSLDILGGQAVQLDRLRRRLSHEPGLVVDFIPVNPRLPGILGRMQRVKYLRTVVTSIAYLMRLLVAVPRYDVIHAFSASYWSYLLAPLPALLVGRLYGKRVLLNYRSGEAPDHLSRWPLSRLTMRLAHEIVVPSGYLVHVFRQFGLATCVVPNFVDVDAIPFRVRERLQPILLSNRNLEPLYNVACVVRAFGIIRRRFPEARLLVAGDGSERGRLGELVAEAGIEGVEFLGRVAPGGIGALYDSADLYLNAPNIDNMPGSIIEAFAAGLPVVSTRAGGIPFVVDHGRTGLLSDLDDAETLAANAIALLDDPARAGQMAAAARAECLERYVWSAVRLEWHSVYRGTASTVGLTASEAPAG